MGINDEIQKYLVDQRQIAYDAFRTGEMLSEDPKTQFDLINTEELRQQYYRELLGNCETYWLEALEQINGVIFEYNSIFYENQAAYAYGIMLPNPEDFKIQAAPYFVGYNMEFAALFEATPGITLGALNIFAAQTRHGVERYEEFRAAYNFTVFLALHDALADFTKTEAFSKVNRFSPFHFLIQEHDDISQPLYIVEAV